MAKQAQGTTARQTQSAEGVPNFGALVEFNERAFEGVMKAEEAMIAGVATFSEAVFSFVQTWLREDRETYQTLIHSCGSPGEVYGCQRRFAEKATSQYLEMANKLTSLARGIAGSAWGPLKEGMGAVKGRTPLPAR